MTTIGETNEKAEFVFEWLIKDFLSLPIDDCEFYDSPPFSFANESWFLKIFPKGTKMDKSIGCVDLYLYKAPSESSLNIEFSLGVKTVDGTLNPEEHFTHTFDRGTGSLLPPGYGICKWLTRTKLLERKSDILPSDTLTLVCRMKYPNLTEITDAASLCQDFKKVLLDGRNHDLSLKVEGKEIRAHLDVLSARSRVFESMLSHDMMEKNSGIIDMPDCDPQAMEVFLLYLYCGRVEALDQSNMLGLYYISDKYEVQGLKKECREFIKKSLSHANICEVIQMALNHSDTSLLQYATQYFVDNTVDILKTVEWHSFLKNNTTVGNELPLKSFQKDKKN